jgi:hypothetical protein
MSFIAKVINVFHTRAIFETCCPIAITIEPIVAKIIANHSIPK